MFQRVREALEMSREELARQLGVDVRTLENWETGSAYPDEDTRQLFLKLDSKLRVYEKLKIAVESLSLEGKADTHLEEMRQLLVSRKPKGLDMDVDDVVIEHLSYAIDDFLRNQGLANDFPKSELARHIYQHIKFLF